MAENKNSIGRLERIMERMENLVIVRTICGGLVNIIPVLIIGAFALILKTFPVNAYQSFITNFAGGFLLSFFDFIYSATFGVLSVYMTFSISKAYIGSKADAKTDFSTSDIGATVASLLSFFILAGAYSPDFGLDSMGPKSMFLAIVTGLGASAIYHRLYRVFSRGKRRIFSAGASKEFHIILTYLLPIALTTAAFAVFNVLIVYIFKVESFRMLLAGAFEDLFAVGGVGFFKGFFFVLLSSVLWFFGIHGSDTLEGVMQKYFVPGLATNQAAVAAGNAPTEILTKEFFDCFVLIGGCGTTISLLIAILLFSKNRGKKSLGIAAAFPMLFNINEMMVFGLPIIFNPIMLIPFITAPLVCYSVAYLAVATGIVPMISSEVAWTTPILLGGFRATGSVAGSILQVVNVVISVLIYLPFVRMLDKWDDKRYREEYNAFVDYFRKNEQTINGIKLLEQNNVYGEFAKNLCADIKYTLKESVILAYQPQYHYNGECMGVEALLRMKHPIYGMLYPPIVVKLAEEGGFLPELEETVLTKAMADREKVLEKFGEGIKISVNVTGSTIVTPRYLQFCQRLNAKEHFAGKNICLEVTEQAAISFDESTISKLRSLRDLGLSLAIDDFSMGQTSLNYLKEDLFNFIKLDGSLVKGLFTQKNCKEIIQSISQLAANLNISILAEYVETEKQREALHEIGCDLYQGYLYSPAVFIG